MGEDRYRWQPATDAQRNALNSLADILFFGGSAGSLKTATLLMDAVQEYRNPNLRGIIFRSSFQEMTDIIDKTRQMYPPLGGTFVGSPKYTWTFKSGATIRFAYMKTDDDVWKYLGPRYSFIGFDESTLHTEKQVRNILGRLSSTDRTLRLRMRLGSNPGNVGAGWHQKLFLRGACPVHEPDKCAIPGNLYWDRAWSDGEPIPFSVAFIPGKLSDHNLLDEGYDRRLGMMDAASSDAMRFGCWCTLEGAYFPFLNKSHIAKPEDFQVEPWFNHFLSLDYGMGQSYAAAGLFVRTPPETRKAISIPGIRPGPVEPPRFPNGRILQIGELCEPMRPSDVFANMVVDAFVRPNPGEQPRSIVAAYLDPAGFNPDYDMRHGTGGHSVSDQIDAIFEPWGLVCQRANNQRGHGWQYLSRSLRDGEFMFTQWSMQTYEAIRTRMIDPEKYLDIVKVRGAPEDDLCVVGETLVATAGGAVPIKDVHVGDFVWTRGGLRRVLRSWMTNHDAETITVTFSDKSQLTGTKNHPVFVQEKGFIRLDEMRYGDNIVTCRSALSALISSHIRGSFLGDIPSRRLGTIALIILQAITTAGEASKTSIARFIRTTSGLSPKDLSSTTRMKMSSTMTRAITSSSPAQCTPACTVKLGCAIPKNCVKPERSWTISGTSRSLGIAARKGALGIADTPRAFRRIGKFIHTNATNVAAYFARSIPDETDFAQTPASPLGAGTPGWTMSLRLALYAKRNSRSTDIPEAKPADVFAVGSYNAGRSAVFNLSVEGENEYFANGVLVHNSDMVRYGTYSWVHPADKPRDLVLKEAIAGLPLNTREGFTSAGIRYQQAAEIIDRSEAPLRLGTRLGLRRR